VASLTAFAVLMTMEKSGSNNRIDDFNGLFRRSPFVAVTMTIALMSLAGIPPLSGFFGKYLVFVQAVSNGYIGLVVLAVGASLVGVYYYFRVIIVMFFAEGGSVMPDTKGRKVVLAFLATLVFVLSGLIDWLFLLFEGTSGN
jgi:NADH-quinone oxidoreductase subunit N